MHWAEKRERDRLFISLPIEYDRIDSEIRPSPRQGYTVNASEDGLMVISRDELPAESDLRVKVFYCSPDLRCVEARSHVVWEVKSEKGNNYLSGIRIMWAGQKDLREWGRFLENLLRLKPF